MNESQSKKSDGQDGVDGDRMVAQIRGEETTHRDLVAPGPRQGAAADERDPDREHEQRPLAKPRGEDVPDRRDRGLHGVGGGHRVHSVADQAPEQEDEDRRDHDSPAGGDQGLAAPALGQVDGAEVEEERQDREHEAEVSKQADDRLHSGELVRAHQDELAGGLDGLAVEQGVDPRLSGGERGIERRDVRGARVCEHRRRPLLERTYLGVGLGQPALELGQPALELVGDLPSTPLIAASSFAIFPWSSVGVLWSAWRFCFSVGVSLPAWSWERVERTDADLGLSRGQALAQVRGEALDEALEL